jgi:acetyl-CoA carboxylase, biotin carboxylase subunit
MRSAILRSKSNVFDKASSKFATFQNGLRLFTNSGSKGQSRKPFDRVLIANRGEISSRVMRTCEAHDIETVAIYSVHDSQAPYVKQADHSLCIGKSYLDEAKVLKAIEDSGAQACMPGYGFFSGTCGT